MKIIEQNILDIECGTIVQSCNCIGRMGGLAGAIKAKWPKVEAEYLALLATQSKERSFLFLGDVQLVEVERDLYVANVFGQLKTDKFSRQTEYCALVKGLEKLESDFKYLTILDKGIYFPYQWGCGLGGGDWKIVSEIIDYHFPDAIICKLPE